MKEIQVITHNNQSTSKEDKETHQKAVQNKFSSPVPGQKLIGNISNISRSQPPTSSGKSSMNKAASVSSLDNRAKYESTTSKFVTQQKTQKSDVD